MKGLYYKKDFNIKNNEILLCCLGDLHFGHQNSNVKQFEETLDWIKKTKNAYVLGMGDLLECSTRTSVGSGIYEQKEIVQGQLEYIVEKLTPIAEEGRLLGLLDGNHETRIFKSTGLNISKVISKMLNVPYFGWGINLRLKVDKNIYQIYATHGSSGATTPSGKINNLLRFQNVYDADCYCMGHVHELNHFEKPYFIQDSKHKTMKETRKHFVLTGSFLGYFNSYAEMKGMQPSKTGMPKISLSSLEHKITVNLG